MAYELDRSFVPTRDTPVNLDDSIYALVPVAAASAAEENNTTLIDTLRVSTRHNTKKSDPYNKLEINTTKSKCNRYHFKNE